MPRRRESLILLAGGLLAAAGIPARADDAVGFVQRTGDELVKVINSDDAAGAKRQRLQAIIDRTVDVDGVARFCLGRFWRSATPQQQKDYTELFHRTLVLNIAGKLGEYKGVHFTIGRTTPRDGNTVVDTTVFRPNNPSSNVQWVISLDTGAPKIEDVIAEGTSLRLTQRSDYASFLQRNNGDVPALIEAMHRQLAQ